MLSQTSEADLHGISAAQDDRSCFCGAKTRCDSHHWNVRSKTMPTSDDGLLIAVCTEQASARLSYLLTSQNGYKATLADCRDKQKSSMPILCKYTEVKISLLTRHRKTKEMPSLII